MHSLLSARGGEKDECFFPPLPHSRCGLSPLVAGAPLSPVSIFFLKASLWIFSAQITCYCETTCRKYVAYGRSTKPGSAWASLPKWLSRQEEEGEKKSLLIKLNEEEGEGGLSMKGGRRKGSFFSFSHSSSGACLAGRT